MAILASSSLHIPPSLSLSNPSMASRTRLTIASPIRCLRFEDHDGTDSSQGSRNQSGLQTSDVWQLFTEAQQNILYLNKQRLMAMGELNNAKREIQTLLEKIDNLEVENQGDYRTDESSIHWEVLLRVDALVLAGMIDTTDACDLRRLVMDSKFSLPNSALSPLLQMRDAEFLEELRRLLEQNKRGGFHIVHICTEMDPIVSVGSLGSYVTGLSRALQSKGNLVEVVLPKYKSLNLTGVQGLQETQAEFYSYFNGQLHENKIWTGVIYGIGVTFIQPVQYSSFFNRDMVYGYTDDFERFSYFARASLDYLAKSGKHPDILHIHNWETAIIGPLFWDIFVNQGFAATRILLTCHGFGSQCLEPPEKLGLCGLDPSRLNRPDRMQDNNKTNLVNILKGGIVYSNKVVVMSSIHSKERLVQSLGHGLEPTLSSHKDKLVVAPYGFENSSWDPSIDKLLPERYHSSDMKGKVACKVTLQRLVGLSEDASSVLVGCIISEISDEDLESLMGVMRIALLEGVQFLFMGASEMLSINNVFESLHEELNDENVKFINKYDEDLTHLVFGGSDIILCHSYEDPLLHLPLKAIKYGAAPILMTSIDKRFRHLVEHDVGSTQCSRCISAFTNISLMQALNEMRERPLEWNKRIEDAMSKDFSWDAECYDVHISAYQSIKNL